MKMTISPPSSDVTLGILAGGRATRLGGIDKAWLQRDGVAQVVRLARRFDANTDAILVSANRNIDRYAANALQVVSDAIPGLGPIGGLGALAWACRTPWLLTLPVDVIGINECLLPSLAAAAVSVGSIGACAVDGDGLQPLVALWRVDPLREGVAAAIASGDFSVRSLQARLRMSQVRFAGVRFGNLNTPADLAAAGVEPVDFGQAP